MTRFVIDAPTAVELVRRNLTAAAEHRLVAPALLRSQALSLLYRRVREGGLDERDAPALLDRLTTMRIRLLSDRVSRQTAWRIATDLGWDDTTDAEYLAVTRLQADALVTVDAAFAARIGQAVPTAPLEALEALAG